MTLSAKRGYPTNTQAMKLGGKWYSFLIKVHVIEMVCVYLLFSL